MTIKPMVTEEYLATLVELVNQRFLTNEERKQRFRRALLKLDGPNRDFSNGANAASSWEPADERRERKRAEGLRRKEEIRQGDAATAGGVETHAGEDGDYYVAGLSLDPDALPP